MHGLENGLMFMFILLCAHFSLRTRRYFANVRKMSVSSSPSFRGEFSAKAKKRSASGMFTCLNKSLEKLFSGDYTYMFPRI